MPDRPRPRHDHPRPRPCSPGLASPVILGACIGIWRTGCDQQLAQGRPGRRHGSCLPASPSWCRCSLGSPLRPRAISQRLTALGSRLGLDPPEDESNIETSLAYLESGDRRRGKAVTESSSDAIRLRRSLDTLTQGVVLCDENGTVIYRNGRANASWSAAMATRWPPRR
jgi:PAS domain-containing protein